MHRFPKPRPPPLSQSFPAVSHGNSYLVSASIHVVTRPTRPDVNSLCTQSLLSHPVGLATGALTSSFTPSKGWPIRRRRRPIRPCNCPLCLLRRQYRCRSGTGSPRRSPLAGPSAPSSRPPRIACARPLSSSRGTAAEAVGAREAHSQGNAGSLCVGIQSRGSSGYRAETAERRRRASGWAHHPTTE